MTPLLSPGEFSVRLRDEGRSVPRVDADERRRPEVSHLSHGRRGLRREESRLLLRRDLLRAGGPAPRTHRLQVSFNSPRRFISSSDCFFPSHRLCSLFSHLTETSNQRTSCWTTTVSLRKSLDSSMKDGWKILYISYSVFCNRRPCY